MKTTIYTSIFLLISFSSFSQQKNSTNSGSFKSVTIGEQVWMSENLNVSTFRNGDPITQAKTMDELIKFNDTYKPAWCYYNFEEENGKIYGKLYNYFAVIDSRGLAPDGWKIPLYEDWKVLFEQLGGSQFVAKDLKSLSGWKTRTKTVACSNCINWSSEYRKKIACHSCKDTRLGKTIEVSGNGSNSSGFNALPGGNFIYNNFRYIGVLGSWWHGDFDQWGRAINSTFELWSQAGEITMGGYAMNDELDLKENLNRFDCYASVRCFKIYTNENDLKLMTKIDQRLDQMKNESRSLIIQPLVSQIDSISANKNRSEYLQKLENILSSKFDQHFSNNNLDLLLNIIEQYKILPGYSNSKLNTFIDNTKPLIAFGNLIAPIKNQSLTTEESKLIGDWDFRSKNIKAGDGSKSYLVDVIRFNKDRTFYFLLQEHDARDDSKLHKLEKTGYWKFENNKLTFYVDFETDDKQKTRVNKTETINFSELADNEAAKTLEIGSLKIEMKGKKRL